MLAEAAARPRHQYHVALHVVIGCLNFHWQASRLIALVVDARTYLGIRPVTYTRSLCGGVERCCQL